MAQLTIYLEDMFKQQVEESAKRAGLSVSKWVADRLRMSMNDRWPDGYFKVFGSVSSEDEFKRATQPSLSDDANRAEM